jgi:Predicted secreted protein
MSIVQVIVAFAVTWWVVLFAVLPFGVRTHHDAGIDTSDGVEPGSPIKTHLGKKLIATTLITILLVGIFYLGQTMGFLTISSIPGLDPLVSEQK